MLLELATRDQMQTTAGSLALVNSRVPADAVVAERLRAAGAVILGKANLGEWANCRGFKRRSIETGEAAQTGCSAASRMFFRSGSVVFTIFAGFRNPIPIAWPPSAGPTRRAVHG